MGDTYCSHLWLLIHTLFLRGLRGLFRQSHHWLSLRLVLVLFRTEGWSRWWPAVPPKQYSYDSLISCWIWKFVSRNKKLLNTKIAIGPSATGKKKQKPKSYLFPYYVLQVKLANQCVFSQMLGLPWQTLPFSINFLVGNHLFQIPLQLALRTNQKHPFAAQKLDHLKNEVSSASSVVCNKR